MTADKREKGRQQRAENTTWALRYGVLRAWLHRGISWINESPATVGQSPSAPTKQDIQEAAGRSSAVWQGPRATERNPANLVGAVWRAYDTLDNQLTASYRASNLWVGPSPEMEAFAQTLTHPDGDENYPNLKPAEALFALAMNRHHAAVRALGSKDSALREAGRTMVREGVLGTLALAVRMSTTFGELPAQAGTVDAELGLAALRAIDRAAATIDDPFLQDLPEVRGWAIFGRAFLSEAGLLTHGRIGPPARSQSPASSPFPVAALVSLSGKKGWSAAALAASGIGANVLVQRRAERVRATRHDLQVLPISGEDDAFHELTGATQGAIRTGHQQLPAAELRLRIAELQAEADERLGPHADARLSWLVVEELVLRSLRPDLSREDQDEARDYARDLKPHVRPAYHLRGRNGDVPDEVVLLPLDGIEAYLDEGLSTEETLGRIGRSLHELSGSRRDAVEARATLSALLYGAVARSDQDVDMQRAAAWGLRRYGEPGVRLVVRPEIRALIDHLELNPGPSDPTLTNLCQAVAAISKDVAYWQHAEAFDYAVAPDAPSSGDFAALLEEQVVALRTCVQRLRGSQEEP